MINNEEWDNFLNYILSNAVKTHRESKEGEYLKQRQEQIDGMLTTNLTKEEKSMVEEVLFEVGLAAERETDIVYKQGFKDCVWILKNLGVLA